jgi:hypothetical protein
VSVQAEETATNVFSNSEQTAEGVLSCITTTKGQLGELM